MVWFLYFVGHFFHTLSKANLAVRVKGQPPYSMLEYAQARWVALSTRLFLTTVLFMAWWSQPTLAQSAFEAIAKHLAPGPLQSFLNGIVFPLNPATAAIYGFASDSILDKLCGYIPWLQNEIPKVNGNGDSRGGPPNPIPTPLPPPGSGNVPPAA